MSLTKIYVNETDVLVSDKVSSAKPIQDLTEVHNTLLDGTQYIQAIGSAWKSFDIEFAVNGDKIDTVNGYAAQKTVLRLERHGEDHIGVISDNPDWTQEIGAFDSPSAVYLCRILFLVTEV